MPPPHPPIYEFRVRVNLQIDQTTCGSRLRRPIRVTFTVLTSKLTSKFSSSHRSKVKANFWVSQSRFLAEIVTCGLRLTKSNLVTGPRSNLTQDREGGSECIRPDQLDCVLSVVGYRPKVRGGGGKFKTQIANWK